MKILIFSSPFSGHLNVLNYLKQDLEDRHEVLLIITGWKNIEPQNINNKSTILLQKNDIDSSDPMTFTLSRVYDLTNECINICKKFNPHLIIYDFFSLEGFITAKNLSIPYICSIPAMIGPYIKGNKFFTTKLNNQENQELFNKIKTAYNVNLLESNIQQVSDGMLIPSDINILWSYNKVIECHDFLRFRNLTKNNFVVVGPRKINCARKETIVTLMLTDVIKNELKKIIYVSFGTVTTQNLWNHNSKAKSFIIEVFKYIVDNLKGSEEFDVIVATGRSDIDIAWPSNFKVYETVNQLEVLSKAHLFITHCGGNSFSEAIHHNVPMIGIPFFGDQHLIADKIRKLGLGISFLHESEDDHKCISTTYDNLYFRKSLTKDNLNKAIGEISLHHKKYTINLEKVKSKQNLREIMIAYHNYPLKWNNGDLLYGTNIDRVNLIKYLKAEDDFRICKYQPFSQLFYDKTDKGLLPRILDMYNDGFLDNNCFPVESSSKFTQYSKNISEFRQWLKQNKQFIAPLTSFDDIDDMTGDTRDQVIWNICLGGIEFFTQIKGYTIHFVLESYSKVNKATTLELEYIRNNWDRLRSKICFYKLNSRYALLQKVNPTLCGII